ncbi:phage tail spike protein [Clostridium perfringens]|uniref:phage tail spike protein n=1 Tax=Clostridium perfringens TaxID=1502 RepID=UPI000DA41E31|nr:phage tail spike protein [Clostridium perfringens]SQI03861.1 phage minor structural protein [Clostridium perfringens]
MLKLKDKNKKLVAGLINYKDLCIESALSTGDKKLSFSLPKEDKFYNFIEEEGYIETKTQEYVIKAKDVGVDYTRFDCVLNLETLEANIFDRFESVEQTITNSLNLAIVGTGWTVKDNTLKKKRTVRCTNKNALEIVQEIKKTYRVDIVFNTLKREIEVYEKLGEDKGTYFIDSLNLTALQVQSDSYKFATRIIAEGKDKLTFADINDGKNYVENYQYSNKVKTIYWKDERYTIKESLLEDAKAKLEEISKPFVSYNASILNLAELNPKYKNILDYKLGDTITLISKNNKVKDKQRIVKTVEYPLDHSRDTVELANAVLKFEDIQQENQETTDTVDNITTDNGTVNGSTIDSITTKQIEDFKANVVEVVNLKAINANIDNLHANKADIQDLHAVTAKIGTLEATKANITQLNAVNAEISKLNAIKVNVTDLNAANGKIDVLESKTASIDNLLAGNLTANNFKANSIVAGSGIIAEGAIGSAQISSLSVNKLEAGEFITSKHKIVSADGTIEIVGNQILINRNNVNRVILGEYRRADGTTEYGLLVRAKDGQTIMLDGNGVHNSGITDGAIDNNKVADNANISGNKLDINSVIREVNNNGTETIAGTRIQVGDRTLDVELSTQKNTITEHSKELSSQKASLTALDNALKFKVDEQVYRDSINTINNNISTTNSNLSKATTELKLLKGKVDLKVNKIDIDKTVKEIEDKIKVTTDKITTAESKFTQENNSIKASVQDLNSTTQTITANINNLNNELTSKINSNLDVAKDYTNAEITAVNSKMHNLESGIDILKEQIKSKVSQSDIDKSITTVDDKIKVLSSNISDVSSSVTQLRDSVTTEINSINSKTHSIETNLNVKASKQEVTDVNNKVTTIKASLDGITQRVSATESKTQTLESNLNGKASKQEVNNVSSKVVSLEANLNGITNRVSSTESRINTLNGQVANATTKQEFTEFKQSTNKFIMDIQQSGNENLCTNGGFESNDTNIVKSKSAQCGNAMVSGKVNEIIPQDGGNFFFIDTNGGDAYAMTTLSFMFEEGQTYTISVDCRYASTGGKVTGSSFVEYWGNYSRIWESQDFGYNWHRVSSTWTAPAGHGAGRAFIRFGIRCDGYAWGAFDNVKVEKGTMATGYTSPGNSICGNTITADYEKLRCQFKSGAYNQMGEKGNMWYAPGMEYPYRALSWNEAVSINTDGSNNYIYRDVQLPARFDYVDPQYIEITASLKGWYKYTGKNFSVENITVSTGKVYRSNGHTYAQVACRGCIRHDDTFKTEGLQVVATLHVTA